MVMTCAIFKEQNKYFNTIKSNFRFKIKLPL
jgi:hypothetical protein